MTETRNLTLRLLTLLSIFFCSLGTWGSSPYDQLDRCIEDIPNITKKKDDRIKSIRLQLFTPNLTDRQCYDICNQLYEEYESFQFDSALVYANKIMDYAHKIHDQHLIEEATLRKANIHSRAGLFTEAKKILEMLDESRLCKENLINYYDSWRFQYSLMAEFSSRTSLSDRYIARAMDYWHLLLVTSPKNSYINIVTRATLASQLGDHQKAINLLVPYLKKWKETDQEYAALVSKIAQFYEALNDSKEERDYLIMSAIADIRGSIKESIALRKLASLLFKEGDVERAYRYLNIAIDDANFYGTRLRNSQASELIPEIQKVYIANQEAQQNKMRIQLGILGFIVILLIVALVAITKLLKRYLRMNRQVHEMNDRMEAAVEDLQEANRLMREGNLIKEEYIGRFLELSSDIIDKVDAQRKIENRLAREKRMQELYQELKSNALLQDCTKAFYENFDAALLNIYPTFVNDVNLLLKPDEQIFPKQDGSLTTELRILALIRLGVHDNAKISSILRSSITTIYTYRSKLKSRSINHDRFESQIKRIGVYEM